MSARTATENVVEVEIFCQKPDIVVPALQLGTSEGCEIRNVHTVPDYYRDLDDEVVKPKLNYWDKTEGGVKPVNHHTNQIVHVGHSIIRTETLGSTRTS